MYKALDNHKATFYHSSDKLILTLYTYVTSSIETSSHTSLESNFVHYIYLNVLES